MRILSRLFLIRLIAKLLLGNSPVPLSSFIWFQSIVCFLIFLIHTITYLTFNLSYLIEDSNHKSVLALVALTVNLLPIYNLVTLAIRLLFNFTPKRKFADTRTVLEFEPKEMARNFLIQEIGVQSYYLLFVWLTRYLSIVRGTYGKVDEKVLNIVI